MPIIRPSLYRPPLLFKNGHVQTIYPNVFRRVNGVTYFRQRLWTPDNDFLDLDWSPAGATRLGIVAHGLEGNSTRPYVLGMVRALNRNGWDAVVWNFRGCSGEPNRQVRLYHSGDTPDLDTVLTHILENRPYQKLALIGFSLGGNIILKYLGEKARKLDRKVRCAVTFSVPCHLASSALKMGNAKNALYMKRFLRLLHQKIRRKMQLFPNKIDDRGFHRIRTFKEFDERYTAPLNGFMSAEDYWEKSSCKPRLAHIAIPTLLINSLDDPFLAPPCFPYQESLGNPFLFLETPETGGHVGFVSFEKSGTYWSEIRAIEFLQASSSTCDKTGLTLSHRGAHNS
jgi:predicted alpha/beta-fold hydrolase